MWIKKWCYFLTFSLFPSQKNRKRRNRKKKNKKRRVQEKREQAVEKKEEDGGKEKEHEVEIEYVTEEPEIYDPNFIFFKRIFEAFKVRASILDIGFMILYEKSVKTS